MAYPLTFAKEMNPSHQLQSLAILLLTLLPAMGLAESKDQVPNQRFQGNWKVERHFFRTLQEGETDFGSLGDESPQGKFPSRQEIRFRRHDSGAIQQIWTDQTGEVTRSKGIAILDVTPQVLAYRAWSDHPTSKSIITITEDGSAVFQIRSLKHQETFILVRSQEPDSRKQKRKGHEDGAGIPATCSESK